MEDKSCNNYVGQEKKYEITDGKSTRVRRLIYSREAFIVLLVVFFLNERGVFCLISFEK